MEERRNDGGRKERMGGGRSDERKTNETMKKDGKEHVIFYCGDC
jgi:hypothetical protein